MNDIQAGVKPASFEKGIWRTAQTCLLFASAGLMIAAWIWYIPDINAGSLLVIPFSKLGTRMAQVVYFGGVPLMIALFVQLAPGPAAIIGAFVSLVRVLNWDSFARPIVPFASIQTLGASATQMVSSVQFTPHWLYNLLYAIFALGCSLHLFLVVRNLRRGHDTLAGADKRIRSAARLIALAAVLVSIVFSLTGYRLSIDAYLIMVVILAGGIAWFWQGAGGMLFILLGAWSIHESINSGPRSSTTIVYVILFSLYFACGVLYLLFAWRRKARTYNQASGV